MPRVTFEPLSEPAGTPVNAPVPGDRPVRWGILATGGIAGAFAENLRLLPDAEIAAVGSRRIDSAEAFAAEHGARSAYGSYEDLVADDAVDVVYVATPHALHHENTMLAFDAGKAVLCEKALTLNAREAEELVAVARERRLFFMEAMWMRCNPVIRRLRHLAQEGYFGEIRQVSADLGFRVDRPATDRVLDPALGGGALLDMGVYPLTFASLFLGEPDRVHAVATLSPTGIDTDIGIALGYPGGAVAQLSSTLTAWSPRTATIATDRGRIDFPEPFHHPTAVTWRRGEDEPEEIAEELIGTGLAHEAVEVMRCLRNGDIESPLVPLDDTLALMRQMDRIRERVGLRYAADER